MVAFHPITPELPEPAWAHRVVAPARDALPAEELAALAAEEPWSFLHVTGAGLSDAHPVTSAARGSGHLHQLREASAYRALTAPAFLLYRVSVGDHVQLGLVGDLHVADAGLRTHEHTEVSKEAALLELRERLGVDTNPVSAACPPDDALDALLAELAAEVGVARRGDAGRSRPAEPAPLAVTAADGVHHEVWPITEPDRVAAVGDAVGRLDAIYLLDGHHRLAAAARHAERAGAAVEPETTANPARVLAALFPRDHVRALDYRRVVRHPAQAGRDRARPRTGALLAEVRRRFAVTPLSPAEAPAAPHRRGEMTMGLDGAWHRLTPRPELGPTALPDRLDEQLVQRLLLEPVFGIRDPRTDSALSYVPGSVALDELADRLDPADTVVVLHPLPLAELQAVADAGAALPPKSTYFTPKLAAGLVLQPRRAPVPAAG